MAERATILAGSGIASTLQHDDLHGGNIFVRGADLRFFDWGDACIAHPFGTLTTTLNSIGYRLGVEPDGPGLARVRDAYLEAWTDVHPRSELTTIARAAVDLGRISRAASWSRALEGVADGDLEGHGGAPAAWLGDLVQRIDRPAGA